MKRRREKREVFFVCSALSDKGALVSKLILAPTSKEAGTLFSEQNGVAAKEIFGPFYKKKTFVPEVSTQLKFSNKTKKAVYNDWEVNAFFLDEPKNHAYLIFIKKTDGKKVTLPTGTVVVPITELRII